MSNKKENQNLLSSKLGPIHEDQRKTQDILCCLLFVAFVFASIVIVFYGFSNGNTSQLTQPYDPDHRACGVNSEVKNYPYIYFVNPTSGNLWQTVCVKSCPEGYAQGETAQPGQKLLPTSLQCATNSVVKSCDQKLVEANGQDAEGTVLVYDSSVYLGKVCIPSSAQFFKQISKSVNVGKLQQTDSDLSNSKWIIVSSLFIAVIVSFGFLIMVEKCAAVIVWTFIILFIGLLITGGSMLAAYYVYLTNPSALPSSVNAKVSSSQAASNLSTSNTSPHQILFFSIFLFISAVIMIVLVICNCAKIKLAIGVIEAAGEFVVKNKKTLFIPPIMFVVIFLFFLWWISGVIYLYACGTITTAPHQLPFGQYQFNSTIKMMAGFHIFSLIWHLCFFIGVVDFVISSACAYWYFNQNAVEQDNVTLSLKNCFRYYLGTIAFGSFLIGLFGFIKSICELFLIKENPDGNAVQKFFFKACLCCTWCIEKCLKFLSKLVYTQTALQGDSFCDSAKNVIELVETNVSVFAIVGGLGDFFVMLGRLFICALTALYTYVIVTNATSLNVQSPTTPTILCAVLGFVIGSIFMSVYGIAIDAVLYCFCFDKKESIKLGHATAQSCPDTLKKFLADNAKP